MSVQVLGGASEATDRRASSGTTLPARARRQRDVIVPTGNTQGACCSCRRFQSLGNFASLDVSGNAVVGGNLSVAER